MDTNARVEFLSNFNLNNLNIKIGRGYNDETI